MMRCAACGAVNEGGRAYCGYCAHSLGNPCPVCQFLNGEAVRYCGGCARDLLAAAVERAPAAATVPVISPDAVRALPRRVPATVFDNLEDLQRGPAPAAVGGTPQVVAADTTQDEIDGFFQRLVREGVAEIHSPSAAAQPPGPPRSAAS